MKKLFALLLVCATLLAMPFGAFAASEKSGSGTLIWVNPMFKGMVIQERLTSGKGDGITASSTVNGVEAAAAYWRTEMKKHTSQITVTINGLSYSNQEDAVQGFYNLYDLACAYTGVSNEGDYIKWGMSGYGGSFSYGGSSTTYTITPSYLTTLAQEQVVDDKVAELIEDLQLPRANDYLTLKALYDWVCANITYDHAHLNACSDPSDPNYYFLMHSAYAAIVDRTCVCQGYTNLMYRVGLDVGLESRMCSSDAQNHIWNVFRMVDLFYECDSTWDAGVSPSNYTYFLRGRTNWLKVHNWSYIAATVGDEYADAGFAAQTPLADDDFSYTRHALKVQPVDGNGNHIGSAVSAGSFMPFDEYSVAPPAVNGYQPAQTSVTGVMPGHDVTVEVEYQQGIDLTLEAEVVEGGVSLTWEKVSGVNSYKIYRETDSEAWKQVGATTRDSFKDTAVDVSTTYRYKLVTAMGESNTVSVTPGRFLDVPPSASCYKAVNWAAENGIVSGTSSTTFSPGASCTRAQFALMLYRLAGKPEVDMSTNPFTDLPGNAGIRKAIVWAYNEGIVNGSGPTTYNPNGIITRAQLILMLYKMADKPDTAGMSCPFKDLDGLTSNNKKAIIWAYNNGIVGGTSATTFSPRNNCTRGQLAIILYRYNKLFGLV